MFSNLFKSESVSQSTKRRQQRKQRNQLNRRQDLRLESLEDRMMLTAVTPTQIGKLFAQDADRGDQFGWRVDMTNDGRVAVIGATKDDESTRNAGAAYVFHNAGDDDWNQVAKLTGPSQFVGRNDEFGEHIAITGGSGDFTIVVGTEQTGEAFVYDGLSIDGNGAISGMPSSPITLSAGSNSLGSMSISRHLVDSTVVETLVVGDRMDSDLGTSAGAAYVFTAPNGDWSGSIAPPKKLFSPTPAANESFGDSVALSADGSTIAIGASSVGEVHIFERGSNNSFGDGTADHQALITEAASSNLGSRLDISGDGGVLVTSTMWTTWVATRASASWSDMTLTSGQHQLSPFYADPGTTGVRFGWSVDINDDGDTILVGTASNSDKSAFSYNTASTTGPIVQGFGQQARFHSSTTTDGNLGNVATNGTHVLIGNHFDDAEGEPWSAENVGAVHVFSLTPTTSVAGISVTPVQGLVTSEDAGSPNHTDTFDIQLDTDPGDGVTVTIPLTSTNTNEGTISASSVVFTGGATGDWNQVQTVTVTGVDDAGSVDGDQAYVIQTGLTVASDASSAYHGLDPADVSVTSLDDDAPPPTLDAVYVYDISFESKRGNKDWRAVFELRIDSNANGQPDATDAPANGAAIDANFAGQSFSGETDASGEYRTPWIKNIPTGDHYANALDIVLADAFWDQVLSLAIEDDSDNDDKPDALLTV